MTTKLQGKAMRLKRINSGISLREVARRCGLSAPYISDLERDRRTWNEVLVQRYEAALAEGKEAE